MLEAAPEKQVAYNTASMPVRHLTMTPLVYYFPLATEHSTLAAQLELTVAYTLALVAAIRLMPKPLAYHWLAVTAHNRPVAAVSVELTAYTEMAQMQELDLLQLAAQQKRPEMWRHHIWNRMIGPALTRNYNLGNKLFVGREDAHS